MCIAEFSLAISNEQQYYDLLVPAGTLIFDAEPRFGAGVQAHHVHLLLSTENSTTYEVRRLALLEIEDAPPEGWIDLARFAGKLLIMMEQPLQTECLTRKDRENLAHGEIIDIPVESVHARARGEQLLPTQLGVRYDITAQRAAQGRILELKDLRRKAAELEASNKELESFSYSVSHDLRSPLRVIEGFALMLEENYANQLDNEARRYIKVIRDGSQRMNGLIDDLLAFSQLGRQWIRTTVVNMRESVQRALDEVLIERAGTPPQIVVESLPDAHADPTLLHHVWVNLIDNAVKYSSKVPSPRIEIGGSVSGCEALYFVKDNGAGFDMCHLSKLFGVFQRLHNSHEFSGTGVGLAIVQRVISRHGGRVWATGELGKGACFFVTLPARQQRSDFSSLKIPAQ